MWISNISPMVFTRVKVEVGKALGTKYPDLYFTTSDMTRADPKFPTVYVHEMPGAETGQDLEGSEINAVLSSFQIEVTDTPERNRVSEVMGEVVKCMKKMRFSVVSIPEFQNQKDTVRQVARFRRVIGQGDVL